MLPRAEARFLMGEGVSNIYACGVATDADPPQWHVLGELVFHYDFVRIDGDLALKAVWKLGLSCDRHFLNYGAGRLALNRP